MESQNLRRDTNEQGKKSVTKEKRRKMCKILSKKKQERKKQVQEGGEREHE